MKFASTQFLDQKQSHKQGQWLVMTPKMQQAIGLLQLSNLELADVVEKRIAENPVLIQAGDHQFMSDAQSVPDDGPAAEPLSETLDHYDAPAYATYTQSSPGERAANIGGEIDWAATRAGSHNIRRDDWDPCRNLATPEDLQTILRRQLNLTGWSLKQREIGEFLIGQMDDDGYLRHIPDEIYEAFSITPDQLENLLRGLKQFEPAGIFAADLHECLRLQLEDKGLWDSSMDLLLSHLNDVAVYDIDKLARLSGLMPRQVKSRISIIKSLSPKPGACHGNNITTTVSPDILVCQTKIGWQVKLNTDTLPRALINQDYVREIRENSSTPEARQFLAKCLSDADWMIQALDQRANTMLDVAEAVMRHQCEFLDNGIESLKPLAMQTVAEEIGVHKSTVSRIACNKFVQTPKGTYDLRFFFSASPAIEGKTVLADKAVKHKIRNLIADEVAENVASDENIAAYLQECGINITRRTVAKYRQEMGIFSSTERRRHLRNRLKHAQSPKAP